MAESGAPADKAPPTGLTPWVLALGISHLSGRSIFVDRYLLFGHFFLFTFWGLFWAWLQEWEQRAFFACFVAGIAMTGLSHGIGHWIVRGPCRDHKRIGS